jgi:hypothetical protein
LRLLRQDAVLVGDLTEALEEILVGLDAFRELELVLVRGLRPPELLVELVPVLRLRFFARDLELFIPLLVQVRVGLGRARPRP